ncbi:MAG TPA: M14 family zinc carboxypeptidase [Thermoanaerobaculia bacterium]|nr:M14 family zinc carboxypeptidase [Thermoanaerobaculia bacterium]
MRIAAALLLAASTLVAATTTSSPAPSPNVPQAEAIEKHPEWDADYSRQIRQFTTGPEFMTSLVDHLPASGKVPSPLKFFGHVAGAEGHLTYAEDVYRYMRALEAASPRVKVFSIGKSEEGREMILVAVSDEKTIAHLDRYKEITRRLADPRGLSDDDAGRLIDEGKPMYYATGAMHSPETGSPEMLMELAYRLAVEDTPLVRGIRDNVIVLFTPVLEVDGRDRMVDLWRYRAENPKLPTPPLVYWGHYVAHDNNRDNMGLALNLSRNVLRAYFDFHPQVVHDLHESVPFLYVSTGTGPYNASLDPLMIDEWHRMAYHDVTELTSRGLPGIWTHGFYDGWAPNYMFWVGMGHNTIGRFYETFGNRWPTTENRVVRGASDRQWFRPNPPLPTVRWSLRNNVNYQQSGLLFALDDMARNRRHFLEQFLALGKRSINKAASEGPAAWVFDRGQKRKGQLRDLMTLLRAHGIEVHVADAAFTIKTGWPPPGPKGEKSDESVPAAGGRAGKAPDKPEKDASAEAAKSGTVAPAKGDQAKGEKSEAKPSDEVHFAAGSFIIRMDQPYSRLADTMLDTQYVRGDERVYDDTGWTLGLLKNLDFKRVVNAGVLKVAMRPWSPAAPTPPSASILAIENTADTDLARLRYALPKASMIAIDEELKAGGKTFAPGTVVVTAGDASAGAIRDALAKISLSVSALDAQPQVKSHVIAMPRLAVLHTWLRTQDEGWFRVALDDLGVPYGYISTQDVSRTPNLREKFDVILFPPSGASDPQEIVNGLPPGPPLPWKKTALTPNLGVDQTDDMRPGLGITGVGALQRFVEEGGLLITVRDTAVWAVQYGLARWVKATESPKLKSPGTIIAAAVTDRTSPIAWGYDETLPIYYSGSPIFTVGIRDLGGERPESRPSGRGGKSDPDIPQGRPFVPLPERPKPGPGEEGFQMPEDAPYNFEPFMPRPEDRPRVIVSFAKTADQLLLSGMLEGGEEIAGKPVVIDAPRGKGHILLFACNPMWRANTQGTYALITNAIMNWDHLAAGRPAR